MKLFIIRIRPKRRIFFVFTILPFMLISIVILHRKHPQNIVYTSEQNNNGRNAYIARIEAPVSLSILRGILVYYPDGQEEAFLPELFWLYRSWLEMMKNESSLWRTDLVIYTRSFTLKLQKLGCVYNTIRTDRNEPPQCRIFIYLNVNLRDIEDRNDSRNHLYQHFDRNRSLLLVKHLRKYEYVDSINIIAECYPSFAMYDYILRTDMDVFLTKKFGRFVPYKDTLLVGRGGYSSPFASARLRRIAKDMNWLYANLTNIGSTWYGPPRVAQRIANVSLEAMLHLAINEFTTPEREKKFGLQLWPEWHYGVLLLYSCDLAINHLVLSENIKLGLAYNLLDQFSTNTDPYDMEKQNRLHIHCWHTLDQFSKFKFKAGKYNHINPQTLINDTSASGYALRMALESRAMSFADLRQGLINAKNSTNL